MQADDPEIAVLMKELDSLRDLENEVEYLFYAKQLIGKHVLIKGIIKEIPGSLKEKYVYPLKLSGGKRKFFMIEQGFKTGDVILRIFKDGDKLTVRIEKNGKDVTDTQGKRTARLKLLKSYASDIGKLCIIFVKHLKERIIKAKEETARKIEEF